MLSWLFMTLQLIRACLDIIEEKKGWLLSREMWIKKTTAKVPLRRLNLGGGGAAPSTLDPSYSIFYFSQLLLKGLGHVKESEP